MRTQDLAACRGKDIVAKLLKNNEREGRKRPMMQISILTIN